MAPVEEIRHHLSGLVLLARGDARGLSHFDISDDGLIRSFMAFAFCLPIFLLNGILRRVEFISAVPDDARSHVGFLFQSLAIDMASWSSTIVAMIAFGFVLGLRPLLRPLTVMMNWGLIAVTYLTYGLVFPLVLLIGSSSTLTWSIQMAILLAALAVILVPAWRILRTVVGGSKWRRAAFIALATLPSAWVVHALESSMGLIIPNS